VDHRTLRLVHISYTRFDVAAKGSGAEPLAGVASVLLPTTRHLEISSCAPGYFLAIWSPSTFYYPRDPEKNSSPTCANGLICSPIA